MKKSTWKAIVTEQCPACRQSSIFEHPFYSFRFAKMKSACEVCGTDFKREPGFYFGAMYFTYAFNIGLLVAAWIVLYFFFSDPPLMTYILGLAGTQLLFIPTFFRYSRVLMLYTFAGIRYKDNGQSLS